MGLQEDVKKLFLELLGPEVAKVIDTFEDPKKYPKDFLEECQFFLEKILGKEVAEAKIQPIYEKYFKKIKKFRATSSKGFLSFLYGRKTLKLEVYSLSSRANLSNCLLHILQKKSCNKYLLYS